MSHKSRTSSRNSQGGPIIRSASSTDAELRELRAQQRAERDARSVGRRLQQHQADTAASIGAVQNQMETMAQLQTQMATMMAHMQASLDRLAPDEGSYFATKLPETERDTKWGDEARHHRAARPRGARLWCGPLVGPLTLPFRLLIASVENHDAKNHDTENLAEPPPPIPSRGFGDLLRLPERGFISGGLYTAMVASGVMSE
ncbi:hypothetical protein QYE76_008173 [Lolium multiflorum]|uniref:Uncharacterized protein n=1 Tax=Lolium multiflorum TaxID=4521 RepID=A0AAD8QJI6_LOLMU|nr:hypothetical protein QYE76_008173 [Lolium multiflorum]